MAMPRIWGVVLLRGFMYVPERRELVEIAGYHGKFLVVWVDDEMRSVDVISLTGKAYMANIPFAELRPFREDAPLETS